VTKKDGHLIESLRKRHDEYHIPLRKEGWEKLERELLSRPAFRRRMYRWISAAAVILVCFALSLPYIIKKNMPVITDNTPGNKTETAAPHKEIASPMQEQQTIVAVAVAVAVKEEPAPILHELPAEEEIIIEEEKEEEAEKPEMTPFTGPQQEKKTNLNYASPADKKKRQSKWAFGLSAGSNNPKSSSSVPTSGGPGGNEPGITDPPYAGLGNGEETARYNYRHRLPISIGISAQKKLSNHFGLESGLTYTYLYSEISKKRVPGHTGNQTLHYLGIPVKANCLLYNQKRFGLYLSGGALLEYCIAANRKTGNQKDELGLNRFQASLNAAAGMQFAITKPLSVFIEPGVSYFIANGSDVETIRTDTPLMFNLQAGIRFTY
jgi:hypothetical protein